MTDQLTVMARVARALERIGVPYFIGGSMASSVYGVARATQDREVSERQWRDVLGILQVRHLLLDKSYLTRWAAQLGVTDLLQRAWMESGLGNL